MGPAPARCAVPLQGQQLTSPGVCGAQQIVAKSREACQADSLAGFDVDTIPCRCCQALHAALSLSGGLAGAFLPGSRTAIGNTMFSVSASHRLGHHEAADVPGARE